MATRNTQTITLADGRRLGFAEFGDPRGIPVLHFHGSASSRLERPADERWLQELGIRLLTADRPGHGLSAPQPRRCLLDWADDVRQLADHLRVESFHLEGWSAGGPHALACAHHLPERVLAVALVSSVAPMARPGAYRGLPLPNLLLAASARWAPGLARLIRRLMANMVDGDVAETARRLMASVPQSDRAALSAPENERVLAESIREGFRGGWQGVALDDMLVNRDWGFDPAEIRVPVDIWHGQADVNVPPHAAQYLHDHIPGARLRLLPGEGHFFLFTRWPQVLAALISRGREAS